MNEQKHNGGMLAAVALGVAAVGLALSALAFSRPQASPVAPAAPSPAPQVVVVPQGSPVPPVANEDEPKLGGLVHNTREIFTDGIDLNNGLDFVDGNGNVSSTDLYVSGLATGNVAARLVTSMSSSATTTACSFLNSSGVTRTISEIGVRDRGTSASLGSVTWVAGTSSYPGVSPVSTGKALNTYVSRLAGVDRITTTSTPQLTGYAAWGNGEYVVFVSNTTTNAGTCKLVYF